MRELVQQRPNSARIRIELGRALTGAGQAAEALEHLNEAVDLTEGAADAHFARGMTAIELGQWDLAQSDLETAIRLDPGSNAIYSALAKVYHATGQLERAEQAYLASLKLEDRNLSVLAGLASLYVDALDVPGEAVGYAERAAHLQPNNPILLDIYGWSLARNGQNDMAREILARALQRAPLPSIHYHLGWTMEQQGGIDDARRQYQQALGLLPEAGEDALRQAIDEALERLRGE